MIKMKRQLFEWVRALFVAVIIVAVIRIFFFMPIVVNGHSMVPTVHHNNRMIVNKFSHKIDDMKRFQIVVFHVTEDRDFIKRVIGLPGEQIKYYNDTLFINGKQYNEPYLEEMKKNVYPLLLTESFSEKVPEGCIFVMGDNRRYSKDSRDIGVIPIENVIGTTDFVYWPLYDAGYVN